LSAIAFADNSFIANCYQVHELCMQIIFSYTEKDFTTQQVQKVTSMRIKHAILSLPAVILSVSLQTASAKSWQYEGKEGPEHWGKLHPDYSICGTGMSQSPINIKQSDVGATKGSLKLHYQPKSNGTVYDTGHFIKVNMAKGNSIEIEGQRYHLLEFHFHTPAEHQMNGKLAPLEMHLVHQDEDYELAVIGVNIYEGDDNPVLKQIAQRLPELRNRMKKPPLEVDLKALLPASKTYYHYSGSLTTPPCSENVKWHVMQQHITLSKAMIKAFSEYHKFDSNRPIQPLNKRKVHSSELQ
jgi:carbonic anhydrase